MQELASLFYIINRAIPTSRCSTAFIGIELNQKAAVELSLISACGGDSCQAYNASNVNLNEIFERLSVSLGIQREVGIVGVSSGGSAAFVIQQRNNPYLQIRQNRFAVLLNLDFSWINEWRKMNFS